MANYQSLKAAINAVIKANGNHEITGTALNEVLLAMVNSLGVGYQFAGVATPSTNPGTPDQNVFYLAGQAGTYDNFGGMAIPDGITVLLWNGSWSATTVFGSDGVFDISAYRATGGTLAKYADLAAALDGGNNIPQSLRKGGMSVKFVQSSDNKYVQYRLMSNAFNTTEANWQGVNDEPNAGSKSDNLVKSGGIFGALADILSIKSLSYNETQYISNYGTSVNFPTRIKAGEQIKLSLLGSGVLSSSEDVAIYYNDTSASHLLGYMQDGSELLFTAPVDITKILMYVRQDAFIAAGNATLNIQYINQVSNILGGTYITKAISNYGIQVDFPISIKSGEKIYIGLSAEDVIKDEDFVPLYYNDTSNYIGDFSNGDVIEFVAPADITKLIMYVRQDAFIAAGNVTLQISNKEGIVREISKLKETDKLVNGVLITEYIRNYSSAVNFQCNIRQGQKFSIALLANGVISSDDTVAMYYNDTSHLIGQLSNDSSIEFTAPVDITQIVMYVRQDAFIAAGYATLRISTGGLTYRVDTMSHDIQEFVALNTFCHLFNSVDITSKLSAFAAHFDNRSQFVEPFLFFTDPHLFYDTATVTDGISEADRQEAMSLIDKAFNMSATKYVLCGGDWLTSHKGTKGYTCLSWIDGIMNALFQDKYYLMNGNHDNNYQAKTHYGDEGLEAIPNDVMVNLLYKRFGNDNMYYSFFGLNTRWFILDTGIDWVTEMTEYRWQQIDWLATQLLACTDAHIAIGMHIISNAGESTWQQNLVPMTTVVTQLLSAYNNRESITLNGYTYNFSGVGGTVHFILAGHSHYDANAVVNGIPVIMTTNVKQYYTGHNITFDLVFADYDVHKLYMTRIGVGSDREITII